jgi:hypothetical protein
MGPRCSESAPSCARDRKSSLQKIPTYVDLDRGDRVGRRFKRNPQSLRLRPTIFASVPRQQPARVEARRLVVVRYGYKRQILTTKSLNRILHLRSGGPVSLPVAPSSLAARVGPSSDLNSAVQRRRHLLSRNDFNQQRLENPRIATLSQHCFSDAGRKWGPANYLVNRNAPHSGASGGGGDGERSHGFKLNYGVILSYTRKTAS